MKLNNFFTYSILFIANSSLFAMEISENMQRLGDKLDDINQKLDVVIGAKVMSNATYAKSEQAMSNSSFFKIKEPDNTKGTKKASNIYEKFPDAFPDAFQNALDYFECPEKYKTARSLKTVRNRFLFYGEPGTGKSYLAKCIHKEFQLPSIKLKADAFQEKFYGETGKRLTELFNMRDPHKRPLILFLDEFDSIASHRNDRQSEAALTTIDSLLVELDKQDGDALFFTFVATNNKHALDSAILSRFCDIELKAMAQAHRKKYIENRLKHVVIQDEEKTLAIVLKETNGLSRRSIKSALNDGIARAIRKSKNFSAKPLVSIDDLVDCIRQEQKRQAVPYLIKIDRFVKASQPYISFINVVLNIGQLALGQWHRSHDKAEKKDDQSYQRNWAQAERELQKYRSDIQEVYRVMDKQERREEILQQLQFGFHDRSLQLYGAYINTFGAFKSAHTTLGPISLPMFIDGILNPKMIMKGDPEKAMASLGDFGESLINMARTINEKYPKK
ncbi:MAG: ATP-binding protein [Candidatus Babeliaceae bacterium]|jgi:AAA+ superfamily predicted ATPase